MTNMGVMLPERFESSLPDLPGFPDNRPPPTDRKLRALLLEWPIFLVCFVVVVALGGAYIVVAPRHYTASAVVMAAPRQPDLSRTDSVLNGSNTPEPAIVREPDIEGEIELMSAPAAVQRVVRELDLDGPSNTEISDRPSVYDLLQQLRVVTGLEPGDPAHPVTAGSLWRVIRQRIRLDGSDSGTPVAPSARRTELASEIVSRNLKIAPIGRSTVVKIDFTAKSSEQAARVATAIAENYIQSRSKIRADAAGQASAWLREHTAELRTRLVDAEARLSKFRADTQLDGRSALQIEGDMKTLGDRIVVAQADQAKASTRLSTAEERVRREGPIGLLSWDAQPGADESLAQGRAIAEMRREASKMSAAVGPFNPNVARLEGEAKGLESKLVAQAQTRLENLRMTAQASSREVASLQAAMLKMRAGYDALEANSVQLSALEQAVIAARTVYQNFQTRWQMTEQSGFNEAKGWLISPAGVPVRPSSPSIPLALIGSVIAGLGVGLSGALWKEHRGNRTLRSSEDVERLLPGTSGLGMLPEVRRNCRSARDVIAAAGTGSDPEFEEAVGNVWTSVSQAIDQRQRSACGGAIVLVSSALPQEGKSAATGVIACAAAAAGHRVVVVDCDLRISVMHSALAVGNGPGVADHVEDRVDYHQAISVNALKRVSVLRAGRPRQAPQQVLRSPRFAAMLASLRNEFDLVVIDSPPVLGLSDARLLTRLADHTILVAAWSRTPWKTVTFAMLTLVRNGGRVAGVILTRANMGRVAGFGFAEAEPFQGKNKNYYRNYYNWNGQTAKALIKGPRV
jgi:succinoglycan biosynthesis transport protein ExoP